MARRPRPRRRNERRDGAVVPRARRNRPRRGRRRRGRGLRRLRAGRENGRTAGHPVNAAGLLSTGRFADLPASEWDRVARVNVAGILNCVKAAMPAATRQRAGRIINIASVSAMRGGGSLGNTIYGATKASVVALTMGLARELGPLGVTVNAVAPAVVGTAMTRAALTDDMRQRIVARIPLGRLAALSDIADLVTFLASDRAAFITGAVIPVDGGILTT
ncbi:MAG: SDR family oxidoreductase [Hyphomicrobiales bacterium]|nr:SDR family oxidoreductase [Hyphomicrobiales bacterium]